MSDEKALTDLGGFSKPATVLIEKVSDAIGGAFKPAQIRRVADAEAYAERVRAHSQVEVTEIEKRGLRRLVSEEGRRQENIETITLQAARSLESTAKSEDVEDDWITHFFDKARLISDEKMQELWSRVLAGEATNPGSFSRRTVEWMGTMDKADAELFTKLCSYCCHAVRYVALVYNYSDDIYDWQGFGFQSMLHLNDIGLVSLRPDSSVYTLDHVPRELIVRYAGYPMVVVFPRDAGNKFEVGRVMLTQTGRELLRVCSAPAVAGFPRYLISTWIAKGLGVYTPVQRRDGEVVRPPTLDWGEHS